MGRGRWPQEGRFYAVSGGSQRPISTGSSQDYEIAQRLAPRTASSPVQLRRAMVSPSPRSCNSKKVVHGPA